MSNLGKIIADATPGDVGCQVSALASHLGFAGSIGFYAHDPPVWLLAAGVHLSVASGLRSLPQKLHLVRLSSPLGGTEVSHLAATQARIPLTSFSFGDRKTLTLTSRAEKLFLPYI
jgi:hypothetical protein